VEAADRGEVAIEPGLVAEKENLHAVALLRRKSSGPSHLALLAVHELVAGLDDRLARPRVGHLLAHLVAARQRWRWLTAHLRTFTGGPRRAGTASRVWGARRGWPRREAARRRRGGGAEAARRRRGGGAEAARRRRGGGAEAADLGNSETDEALVAGEAHRQG
jgi:hypothetical protein